MCVVWHGHYFICVGNAFKPNAPTLPHHILCTRGIVRRVVQFVPNRNRSRYRAFAHNLSHGNKLFDNQLGRETIF